MWCHWQMGLKVSKVNVDKAVEVVEMTKPKPLREVKVTDLPIGDNAHGKSLWEYLIRLLIDWAGTTDDPFGTNEHPELMPTLQELWKIIFEEYPLDVTDHPAIKKLVHVDCTKRGHCH